MEPKKHKVVVADFDGVFVRMSEFFKRDAWPRVFAPYGDSYKPHFDKANQEYEQSKRGDRFTILRATYLGLGEPEQRLDELVAAGAQVFDAIVQDSIVRAGVDENVVVAFKEISSTMPVYLNSATPLDALRRTVSNLGIAHLFTAVLGRPNSKAENFALVAVSEGVEPQEILFIGDSQSDFAASEEFGCSFVGWANEWNGWMSGEQPFPVIRSMNELKAYL
jgi:phosphoglycolate phosphatase-like HAD superfamily hydrolase